LNVEFWRPMPIKSSYSQSFESHRRIHPRWWDSDFCLLRGLAAEVGRFASTVLPTETVVDFGCGAKPYRSLFPMASSYLGVDIAGNPNADLTVNAEGHIPLAEGSADCVLSTQVVYLVASYPFYLAECRRILKPGGRLLLTTHGTWTHHPASGGDYYRFTQDGVRRILTEAGFGVDDIRPVVGTLGTGLHLRQLVFNSWLRRLRMRWIANSFNVMMNARILIEDKLCPEGTRMSCPVIFVCSAHAT